uniref:Uncharacterized protein n=1 Tax=Octopus bimaculoides TaxID=37653 RepID=A0A0L8GW97_OCTBM
MPYQKFKKKNHLLPKLSHSHKYNLYIYIYTHVYSCIYARVCAWETCVIRNNTCHSFIELLSVISPVSADDLVANVDFVSLLPRCLILLCLSPC